jgi:hypothetical protein
MGFGPDEMIAATAAPASVEATIVDPGDRFTI